MKKGILILCLGILAFYTNCYGRNPLPMQNLDSLLKTYTTKPMYYAKYGNKGCLFELYVNGALVDKLSRRGIVEDMTTRINSEILSSGKQKIKVCLLPFPGESTIQSKEPFHLEIGYYDLAVDAASNKERKWNIAFILPTITIKGNVQTYEQEGEFKAEIPYRINDSNNCIDLREVPDIEKRVVEEFKRVRLLMINRKFDELKEYFLYRNNELSVSLYESREQRDKRWRYIYINILKGMPNDYQPIEDYELVFSKDGRVATLRSKKKDGFPSALLWIKQEKGESEYQFHSFYLNLGIRKGEDKLIPLI